MFVDNSIREQADDFVKRFAEKGYDTVRPLLNRQIEAMIACTTWTGKTVIELGALDGRHGEVAVELGAEFVSAIDGRADNLAKARPDFPDRHAYIVGRAEQVSELVGPHNVGLAFGILYHVYEPLEVLGELMDLTSEVFVWTHIAPDSAMHKHHGYYGLSMLDHGSAPFGAVEETEVFLPRKDELAIFVKQMGWNIVIYEDMPTPVSDMPAVFMYAVRCEELYHYGDEEE